LNTYKPIAPHMKNIYGAIFIFSNFVLVDNVINDCFFGSFKKRSKITLANLYRGVNCKPQSVAQAKWKITVSEHFP